ncbi:MAG: DUF2793 domain-containing protein [Pseudomonadota bacterium]
MSNSLNLELPYLEASQSQKHVTVNDALRRIDSLVQLAVEDRSRSAPPAAASEGDRYIVGPTASGAWTGKELNIATYQDGAWVFFAPREGWVAFSRSEGAILYYDGSDWEILTAVGASDIVPRIGVNTVANEDTTRLKVASEAVLFEPDNTASNPTGSARVYVNKNDDDNTASHLFQTNYSGRAEFGLLGSDEFSLKVSPDGSTWTESFSVDSDNGKVDFASLPTVAGAEALLTSISTRAEAEATNIPTSIRAIETRGYNTETDGGIARYERVNSLPADGLGFSDAAGGFWKLAGNTVTARQAGARGNGSTDDTAALRRAFNSGRNVFIESGTYYITGALATAVTNQRIIGDGRGKTQIKVDTNFPLNASGVIRVINHYTTIQDIEIDFDQSSASSRGTLVRYPPAVNVENKFRVRLTALRFRQAYDGIKAVGNCGGAIFEDIECGSFNEGIWLDGSRDTVELRNCRVWPYEFAGVPSLINIFTDGNTIGFRIGEVDDLKMTNCTPFQSRLIFEASNGKRPFGTINGLALDGSRSSIEMYDGEITISSLYATTNEPNDTIIRQTGGILALSDFNFEVGATANVPVVLVDGTSAVCLMQNGRMVLGSSTAADGCRLARGKLTVSSVRFVVEPTTQRTGTFIRQIAGDLVAYGNAANGNTSGTGAFLRVQSDSQHMIFGNDSNGWGMIFPANRTKGTYGPNHDGSKLSLDSVMTFGAMNTANSGGEFRLEGAGGNRDVRVDNSAGNVRFSTLAGNKSLQVITDSGTASLSGDSLRFSNGLVINRGASDEIETTALGEGSLNAVTSGSKNTAMGKRALEVVREGESNTAVGHRAGCSIADGHRNTIIGASAARDTASCTGVTLVGMGAGLTLGNGANNTGIGRNAFHGVSDDISNSSVLGYQATVTGSNQVQLGNSKATTYTYGAVQNRSDARDKADIRDTALGLDFLRALRPVDFRWNFREDYQRPPEVAEDEDWTAPEAGSKKRQRFHHGFIAQDLEAAMFELGVEFGGFQDHSRSGGADVKSIGYEELIAPLVKAVQQIADRLDDLENPAQ